jgi:hypothetical protein
MVVLEMKFCSLRLLNFSSVFVAGEVLSVLKFAPTWCQEILPLVPFLQE